MMATEKTRTEKTERNYRKMGRSVMERFQRETGGDWTDEPMRFSRWFCQHRSQWKPSYWRLMRAAMKFTLSHLDAPVEALELMDDPGTDMNHGPAIEQNTPSKGKRAYRIPKKISNDLMEQYINKLRQSRGPLSNLLGAFLYVNQEIGLRPKEWADARLSHIMGGNMESLPVLIVQNAKNTNGRSTGETRTLILNEVVERMVKPAFILRDEAILRYGDWTTVQDKLSAALGDFRRHNRLPPLNLYSTRHQFAANAKSAGLSKRQIADLMGHESDETAGTHYGKKRYGRGYINVTALNNDDPRSDLSRARDSGQN